MDVSVPWPSYTFLIYLLSLLENYFIPSLQNPNIFPILTLIRKKKKQKKIPTTYPYLCLPSLLQLSKANSSIWTRNPTPSCLLTDSSPSIVPTLSFISNYSVSSMPFPVARKHAITSFIQKMLPPSSFLIKRILLLLSPTSLPSYILKFTLIRFLSPFFHQNFSFQDHQGPQHC